MPSQSDFTCVLPDNATENELRELQERNCQKVKEALHDFQLASEVHWLSSAQAADWTAKASKASAICEQSVQAADWGDFQAAASLAVNAWGSVVMQGAECCTFVSPPFCQDMVRSPATVAMGGLLGLLVLMLAGAACVFPSRPGAGGPESVDPAEEEEPAPPPSGRSARLTGGALGTELEEHWLRGSCLRAMPGASSMARTSSGLFGALHQAFDFQADSVRNQFDHLLSLWRSHCATVADRALGQGQLVDERGLLLQALPELHAELLEGFQRWRTTLQGRKEAGVPDRGISLPLLGGAWWEPLSAMAASDEAASPVELSLQLAEVVTYLLVWGEAGNLRFMPEVIYFITELALAAGHPGHTGLYNVPGSVHVEAASPFHSGLFLAKVIRPIYNVIFSEWYDSVSVDAKTGRDRKRLHRGFEVFLPPDVANYDDWNELFCDPPRLVEALVLTDGKRLFDLAHERRFAALARVDWRASLDGRRTKTHREIHSLWGVFASAHRVVLVHLLLFSAGICVVAGNPAASTGKGQVLLAGREAPERFAALGLLVPLHGLMYAIARWQTLGRAITHRSPVAYYAMSCCRFLLTLVPLVTYVGVRQLELRGRRAVEGHTDALCALVLHCVVSVLGLLYFLLVPGRRLDRLWSMTPAPVHLRALRYTFWFVVLGVKLLLGMFVFRSVFQEGVGLQIIMLGHLSLADLPRAFQSTVWLSHMLECAVLWFTTFFLFVADTQLWFTIACTVLGVAVACSRRKCRVASQNLCGDGVVKIPERFTKKVLCYSPEVEQPCSSSSHFAVLWDRIMEYMRYEDKCDTHTMRQHSFSGSRDTAPVWTQLSLPLRRPGDGSLEAGGDGGHRSPTGTSACWPAAFAPNAGKACSGPATWPDNAEAQWRLLALARGLSLPMPRPFRVPYVPGVTVLIPHYGESILLLKNELFCGHEEGSHRVPLMDWVQAHYGEELKAFLTRRREVGGESGTAWPEAQASWCEFDAGQWDQICTWASMRMQTLWRTVAGMCLYHPALQCHYELQADRLSCLARRRPAVAMAALAPSLLRAAQRGPPAQTAQGLRAAAAWQYSRLWVGCAWRTPAPILSHRRESGSWSVLAQRDFSCPWRSRLLGGVRRIVGEVIANADIPFERVRVVDDQGLLGDFLLREALAMAKLRKTDLVVVAAEVEPALCRLVALDVYREELEQRALAKEGQQQEDLLRQFSFDPAMKVKGMRFTAMIDEHDLERKVNRIRAFLELGHRVEARILQGRCPPEDVLDLALRIIAELRDLAKPESFEESLKEFQETLHAPKSLKRARKANADELRLRLWPCTPEQAATFKLPAQVVGPRRRRGPRIAGIDDGEQPEDAWKLNRKPRARDRGATKRSLRDSTLGD